MQQTRIEPKEFKGKSPGWIQRRTLQTYLVKSWVGGDLSADEKKVNRSLNDTKIRIRFHVLLRQIAIWYEPANSPPYCVAMYALEKYSAARVIRDLKAKQKTGKEIKNDYLGSIDKHEKDNSKQRRTVAREFAKDFSKIARGRVTSSG